MRIDHVNGVGSMMICTGLNLSRECLGTPGREIVMRYEELTMTAKARCVYEYLTGIVPYDSDEYESFEGIEYSIVETLKTGLLSIDEDGCWYDEDETRI